MPLLSNNGKRMNTFDLQIDLHDQSNNIVTRSNAIKMTPRYTNASTAAAKTFSAGGDYADSSSHNSSTTGWSYDLKVPVAPSGGAWYNQTYGDGAGRRGSSSSSSHSTSINDFGTYASLYMDLAVGENPHPGYGAAAGISHIAMLYDAAGAYFGYQYTSPPPVNYTHARTWFDTSTDAQNIKISGQNYGGGTVHNYRQWFCMGDRQSWAHNNVQHLRFINWGPNNVYIHSAKLILHGQHGGHTGTDN